jgi:hypothetical protein
MKHKYLPPFRVVALRGGPHPRDTNTKVIAEYRTRDEAERAASKGSREDSFSIWYEVKARTDAYRHPAEWRWVTIYKGGWLKDAQLLRSYEPPDQRAEHMSYRKVPRAFRQGVRANQSPRGRRSPQSDDDFGMTIVQYKNRWNLKDDEGTVLGSYTTREQAVAAMEWWKDFARKQRSRSPRHASAPRFWRRGEYKRLEASKNQALHVLQELKEARVDPRAIAETETTVRGLLKRMRQCEKSPQSIAATAQRRAVTSPFLRMVIRTMAVGEKAHVEPHGVLQRTSKSTWILRTDSSAHCPMGSASEIYKEILFYMTHGRVQ